MNTRPPIESPGSLAGLIDGAVHIYRFVLQPPLPEAHCSVRVLSTEELTRASRIVDARARTRFVVVRSWLRCLLGHYLESDPKQLVLDAGRHGKPCLRGSDGKHGLVFNATHSGNQAALAFAFDAAVGIDIELWRRLTNAEAMARRCFAPSELDRWLAMEPELRRPAFFRLWTLKEAFCKAVGRGLALGMARCVFDCSGEDARLISHPVLETGLEHWHTHEFGGQEGFSGALLIDRPFKAEQKILSGAPE